jgi:hypothetical protein
MQNFRRSALRRKAHGIEAAATTAQKFVHLYPGEKMLRGDTAASRAVMVIPILKRQKRAAKGAGSIYKVPGSLE